MFCMLVFGFFLGAAANHPCQPLVDSGLQIQEALVYANGRCYNFSNSEDTFQGARRTCQLVLFQTLAMFENSSQLAELTGDMGGYFWWLGVKPIYHALYVREWLDGSSADWVYRDEVWLAKVNETVSEQDPACVSASQGGLHVAKCRVPARFICQQAAPQHEHSTSPPDSTTSADDRHVTVVQSATQGLLMDADNEYDGPVAGLYVLYVLGALLAGVICAIAVFLYWKRRRASKSYAVRLTEETAIGPDPIPGHVTDTPSAGPMIRNNYEDIDLNDLKVKRASDNPEIDSPAQANDTVFVASGEGGGISEAPEHDQSQNPRSEERVTCEVYAEVDINKKRKASSKEKTDDDDVALVENVLYE